MFFLNLTLPEFFTFLGTLGGLITALYLLDRAKRKKVVSTLRFWTQAASAEEQQSRKRMREPWSLILQLVSLLLLLLAIGQLQWGTRDRRGRDHILLVDTSAWTAERTANGTLLDQERAAARRYIGTLAGPDRIMLVRADALTVPLMPFTTNHVEALRRLAELTPTYSALNLEQALSFARQAESWSGGQTGEVVYVGPAMISEPANGTLHIPNLRMIPVHASRENCGILRMSVKRSAAEANSWQADVVLKNYGSQARVIQLNTQFAGTVFKPRSLALAAGSESTASYEFVTNTAGKLEARIAPRDGLASDDEAVLELPRSGVVNVAVFTARPEFLHPLFDANRQISAKFLRPESYDSKTSADVVVFDQFTPKQTPTAASLWIDPPRERSPLPVKQTVRDTPISAWHTDAAIGSGLYAKEVHLPTADVFETRGTDLAVASIAQGPVVVARAATARQPQMAVIGFDPFGSELRYQITTPLLFANLLRWLSPDAFRALELSAGRVGVASMPLGPNETTERLRVEDDQQRPIPFTIREHTLELFAGNPSVIRVLSDERQRVLSLTLPDLATYEWKPPADVAAGIPSYSGWLPGSVDLWRWLALLGAAGLLAEWILFGRYGTMRWRRPKVESDTRTFDVERELVTK